VLGLASLVRVFAVPAWGWAADGIGRHRTVLFAAAGTATFCAAALPGAVGMGKLLALILVGGVASAALTPLCDTVAIALAGQRRLDYGRTRAWGSVSYMVATAGAGTVFGQFGIALVPWSLAALYGAASLLTAALPVAFTAPSGRARPAKLGSTFRVALLATALIQGSHAAYYGFAGLRWRAAGISDAGIGLLIAEGIIAEIALFIWGRALVERLGPARLTALAAACCLVRWTATALTSSVPVLATVQLLHAGTFACQHLSSMLVLRTLPPGRAGMAQTVLASLGFSGPTGVLLWVSGRLYDTVGGGSVFMLMALLGGSALVVAPRLPGAARPQ